MVEVGVVTAERVDRFAELLEQADVDGTRDGGLVELTVQPASSRLLAELAVRAGIAQVLLPRLTGSRRAPRRWASSCCPAGSGELNCARVGVGRERTPPAPRASFTTLRPDAAGDAGSHPAGGQSCRWR
jgi:hypothetical protein